MKKETLEKIEEEINEKTKLPEKVKGSIRKEVFINITIAIGMILYFVFLIIGSVGTTKNIRIVDFNIFSIILLATSIILFEISYRKQKGKLAIHGIETLLVAILTLFLPYIIFELDPIYEKHYMIGIAICISLYYVIKSIYISIKSKNGYMDNISDIKEIVKKEKLELNRKKDIQKETVKKEEKNIEEVSKKVKSKKEQKEEKNKQLKGEIDKKITKTNAPKKRGRPKKEESSLNKDVKKEVDTPKKRGRPRKAVTKND